MCTGKQRKDEYLIKSGILRSVAKVYLERVVIYGSSTQYK